ncbi:MAG: hypothetical protein N2449_09470 [Bacteroidales bacterium]|nr:hypothetical protein [Bacteroidales bacterium]
MKTIRKYLNFMLIYMGLTIFTNGCTFAQKKDDPMPKPKVQYHVNKEVDEHGNIIRYDSTYTWSWSNIDSNYEAINNDSIFSKFFKDWRSPFDDDSLFFSFKPFSFPSFDDEWFNIDKQMQKMMQYHQQIMKQHEEMMKRFLEPKPLIPAPDDNTNKPQQNMKNSPTKKTSSNNQQGIDM